ncbi:molybdopterin-dependent oxidoreductase [Chitinophaga alhagiae]|nr:molybdopterin-dependent oxidoreductase [Chitinophaga alhagiae]
MKLASTTVLLLLHLICHGQAEISDQVAVKGLIERPFTINLKTIGSLQPEVHNNLNIVCSSGETKKELRSFRGVALKRILDSAGIVMPRPKERGKYYIAVRATDGYTTLYAWNEIYNNPTGNHVFLIYEENGQPIREDGRFVMICGNDVVTGPRHVKWVSSISVEKLP